MARSKQVLSLGGVQLLWFCIALKFVCTITDNCREECNTLTEDQLKPYRECPPGIYRANGEINLVCDGSYLLSQEEIIWLKDGRPLKVNGRNFSKSHIQSSDSGNYTCQRGGQTLNSHLVLVAEPLGNIPTATCSATSRGRFNISWHGDSNHSLPTLYRMVLQYSQDSSQCRKCTFTNTSKSHLFEFEVHTQGHYGNITATNCLSDPSSPTSSVFSADRNCLLKTLPPRNVQLVAIDTSSINVTFDLPEEWDRRELMWASDSFIFSYNQSMIYYDTLMDTIEGDITKVQSLDVSETKMTYILKVHDKAYSRVCVRVGLKVSDTMPDFSEFACTRLKMARPSSYPKGFEVTNSKADEQDREKRTVDFKWKPLSLKEANGIITSYRMTLQRIGDQEDYHEFNISSDKTSYKVKDLSSRYKYEAILYAANSVGESDPTPPLTVNYQNQSHAAVTGIIVILGPLVFLSVTLCAIRLYYKIKKRVRPKLPEPVYYSKLHMTQLQSRQLPEPEVFDALNPPPTDSPTDMPEDSIVETTVLSIAVPSLEQAGDYSYAPLESSNGSLAHEGSQDFTGLQGGNQDIRHNTYTALPPPNSEVSPDGETHFNGRDVQQISSQEESFIGAAEGYSMLGLIPLQDKMDSGLSSEKSKRRIVNRNEDTIYMENTPYCRQGEMDAAAANTGKFEVGEASSQCNTTADNYMPTYGGRPTEPNDLSRETSPYVSKDVSRVRPFNISASSNPSNSLEANSEVRDHKEFQKGESDPYVHHRSAATAPFPQHPSNMFSNLNGTVRQGNPNPSHNSVVPTTRQVGVGVTLPLDQQLAGLSEQCNSNQLDDPCHGSVQNKSDDSYIPMDRYVSNGQDIEVESDEYVSHRELDVNLQANTGLQTELGRNSTIQPAANDPNNAAVHGPKQPKDQQFDPYVLHLPYSAKQSTSASAHPFSLVEKSPRKSEIPDSTFQNNRHSDPYVAHECESMLGSRTQRLHPSSEATPTERAVDDRGASFSSMESPDPYVSHLQVSGRPCILTTDSPSNQGRELPKKTDRPCKPDNKRDVGIKGSMAETNVTSDPYVPHLCAATGAVCPVPSGQPHNSKDFGITSPIAKDNGIPDHYVPHERFAAGPETHRNDGLPSQKVGEKGDSAVPAVKPPLAKQIISDEDPYVSHSDASRGSCPPRSSGSCVTSFNGCDPLCQEADPYVSHDAVAGSQFGTKPEIDPHDHKLSDGMESSKPGERLDDPYIPHRILEGKSEEQHVPLMTDGYVPHNALSGKE